MHTDTYFARVRSSDGSISTSAFGMAPLLNPPMDIVDSSSLSYSGDWETDDDAWFSHNKTLKTTKSVGASVTFIAPDAYSALTCVFLSSD